MLRDLNAKLGSAAGHSVAIVDCERLASNYGKARWLDPRYWYVAKQAVNLEALPTLALNLMAVIAAVMGLARKCLVVDLDGTLWGGVIGEDGVEGIVLGHGAEGEAYAAFQDYLLALKDRGVVLAVCSKNDEAVAREPFGRHPDMRLRESDFAAFVANWKPKPENIEEIARLLAISTDAIAFVDDQPAERAAVRRALPEVDVITLPDDVASYTPAVASYPFFEIAALTEEDRQRAEQYRARALVKQAATAASSIDDFLIDLEMRAEISPFDELHLPRIAQLVGKTNQFNLTTRRHSQAELRAMMSDPAYLTLCARLEDRFADNGVVSVLIAHATDTMTMEIDTFLMSCRVIGRTLEHTMLDALYEQAVSRGVDRVIGVYRRSTKNGIVADFYDRAGYQLLSDDGDELVWGLDMSLTPDPNPFISMP